MADLSSKLKARTNPQTQCPNCQTVFEVARELLSSSDTRVRCGECLSIFDALKERQTAEQMAQGLTANSKASTLSSQSVTDVSGRLGDETADLDITYSGTDIFSKDANLPEIAYFDQTRDTPDLDFDTVEMGNDETFNDYLFAHDVTINAESDADSNSPNRSLLKNQSQLNAEYADVDFVTNEQSREPLIFNYRDHNQGTSSAGKSTSSASSETAHMVPRAHGLQAQSVGSTATKPELGTSVSAKKRRSEKSPWLLRIGLLALLGALLVALFVYRTRPQLYNNPTLRPMFEIVCNIMRCNLPARVDVASLKMIKRNVYSHPSTPNTLVINVSFRNEADFAQQLPVLQMVLSNRVGRVVAKQDFIPNYYMPNWREGVVIDAKQQLDVKLEVADPGQDAQNFEFHFLAFRS